MSDSPEHPPTDVPAAEPPSSAPPPAAAPTDAAPPAATPTGNQDTTSAATPTRDQDTTSAATPTRDQDTTSVPTPAAPPPPTGAAPPPGPTPPEWQPTPPPAPGAVPPPGPAPTPPGWDPHRPPAWGPPGPVGPARPPSGAGAIGTLLGSAITLGLGAVVTLSLFVSADAPDSYLSDDFFLMMVATLAAAAAPVALLLAWDEFDLSGFGAAALGGYLYAEVGDGAVVLGLFAAAVAGLAIGAVVGVVRWLTGAHSALVTFGAGVVLVGFAQRIGPGASGMSLGGGRIDNAGLPFFVMLVVVGVAVLLAVLFRGDDEASAPVAGAPAAPGGPAGPAGAGATYAPTPGPTGARRAPGLAGPRVIPGFALSVMGATLFGALQVGAGGFYAVGYFPLVPILVFTAVAVGGVVRGSGFLAPLTATVAAVMVVIIQDATRFHAWKPGNQELLFGVLIVACASLSYGLRRIMRPAARSGPAPGSTF